MSSKKLSQRLNTIIELAKEGSLAWDIGCDHGHVGVELYQQNRFQKIHFVDPSEQVINKLKQLVHSDIPLENHLIHHQKCDELFIDETQHQCFILAGFGGQQIVEGLMNIHSQLTVAARFIISPHRDYLAVRRYLNLGKWSQISENVVFEEGQFYPILVVDNTDKGPAVDLYGGKSFWQSPEGAHWRESLRHRLKRHQNEPDQCFLRYLNSF